MKKYPTQILFTKPVFSLVPPPPSFSFAINDDLILTEDKMKQLKWVSVLVFQFNDVNKLNISLHLAHDMVIVDVRDVVDTATVVESTATVVQSMVMVVEGTVKVVMVTDQVIIAVKYPYDGE